MKTATALVYRQGMEAPLVICNGRAEIASKMIEIAGENKVPVVYEPETAEILSMCPEGETVPFETWQVIAGIFAFIRGQIERIQ